MLYKPRDILLDYPLTQVDTYQDVVNKVYGETGILPAFGWKAGDDNTPSHWLGAENSTSRLTTTGTPTVGSTGWEDSSGNVIASEVYDGSSYRSTATAVDPALTDDVVVVTITNQPVQNNTLSTYLTTRGSVGQRCILMGMLEGDIYFGVTGDSTESVYETDEVKGTKISIGVVDRDGDLTLHVNGVFLGSDTTPDGAIGGGYGLGLAASATGDASRTFDEGSMALACMWYGSGIADVFNANSYELVKDISNGLMGLAPKIGNRIYSFSRDSAATMLDSSDNLHIVSSGMPRAGNSLGYLGEPSVENECYINRNFSDLTSFTCTGGVTPTVETVDLSSTKIEALETEAIEVANSSGGPVYIYQSGATGDTDVRSLSCYGNITAGSGAELGLYDASAGTFQKAADLEDSWARTLGEEITPGDTDCYWSIKVPDSCTVQFLGQQLEKGTYCTSLMPNDDDSASATRAAETITLSRLPKDNAGRLTFDFTPTFDGKRDADFIKGSTSGDLITLSADEFGTIRNVNDSVGCGPDFYFEKDTEKSFDFSFGAGKRVFEDSTYKDIQDYDGDLSLVGDLEIVGDCSGYLKNLKRFRKPQIASDNDSYIRLLNDQSTLETTEIKIKCPAGGSVDIDWGDGNTTSVVCDDTLNSYDHDYGSTGQYVIRVTGTLEQIAAVRCQGETQLSGDISAFSALTDLEDLTMYLTPIGGDVAVLENMPNLYRVSASRCSISGDLKSFAVLPDLTALVVYSTNIDKYTSTTLPAWTGNDIRIYNLGLSSTEVDNFLIDLNDAGGSNGTLEFIAGNAARTSASDDAYAGLLSRGWGGDIT